MSRLAIGLSCFAIIGACEQAPSTYSTNCPVPSTGWGGPKDGIGHLRAVLPVLIDASGSTRWAGKVITDDTLRYFMTEVSKLNPEPQVVLEVASATPCGRVQAVREIMKRAPLCKKARLCSEGANWKEWPIVGGP